MDDSRRRQTLNELGGEDVPRAEIRSSTDTFHFFGEANGYNLQTLELHVRETARHAGTVQLRIELDPGDRKAFARQVTRRLRALSNFGTTHVEVTERPRRSPQTRRRKGRTTRCAARFGRR